MEKTEETILIEALEMPVGEKRDAFVQQACVDRPELKASVESLLRAYDSGDFLERLAPITIDDTETGPVLGVLPGTMIGPYKLREQIGEGGFGVVYVAEQEVPIRRKVALKLIKPGMDSKMVIARFEAERQALAMMDHPNVAKVLDAGTTDRGIPYFVMELVRGGPITHYCDQQKLSIRSRLELFCDVCGAVQHAHQKGIIHRDLKPSNVMVTMRDDRAVVKVIDFGVAKALHQRLTDKSIYTAYGQMIGTPMYMSPEQAQLNELDVDTRSDVYSLGVLLYELMTGMPPFDTEMMRRASYDELRRIIRETEPPRPSTRISTMQAADISTIADQRHVDVHQLRSDLRRELDWIVMKSLEKDRNRRFESPSAFAADIHRYLNDQPVQACPPSNTYRFKKYAKRHKSLLTATAVVFMTALAGMAASLWYANTAAAFAAKAKDAQISSEQHAQQAIALAERSDALADEAKQSAKRAEQAAELARIAQQREEAERKHTEVALYVSNTRLAAAQSESGLHAEALEALLRQNPVRKGISASPAETDMRGWEWYYLLDQSLRSQLSWQAHPAHIADVGWSPDGKYIATASYDESACIWDAETGEQLHRFYEPGTMFKCCVAWHPNSEQLAWGAASSDSKVRIWQQATDSVSTLERNTESIWSVRWNRAGNQLLVGGMSKTEPQQEDDNLALWEYDANEWRIKSKTQVTQQNNIAFAGWNFDESFIVVIVDAVGVRILDPTDLSELYELPESTIFHGDLHPAKNLVAYAAANKAVVLDLDSRTETARFDAHFGRVSRCVWSVDGKWLATCGADGAVKIWDASNWKLEQQFRGHTGNVAEVAWHPESQRLASVGDDGIVNVWLLDARSKSNSLVSSLGTTENIFAWTNDNLIRAFSYPSTVIDQHPRTGGIVRTISLPDEGNWYFNNRDLVARRVSRDSQALTQVVSLSNPPHDCTIGELRSIRTLRGVPGGEAFAGSLKKNLKRITVVSMKDSRETILGAEDMLDDVIEMAWSTDQKMLAAVGRGLVSDDGNVGHAGWLYLFNPASGQLVKRVRVGESRRRATVVAWSRDSLRIVAGTEDGVCEVFESADLRRLMSKPLHLAGVKSMHWHPDGTRIASGGEDRTVVVWDSQTGESLLKLQLSETVQHVEWSPNGKMLAAKIASGEIFVWDADRGYQLAESRFIKDQVDRKALADYRRGFEINIEMGQLRQAAENYEKAVELAESLNERRIVQDQYLQRLDDDAYNQEVISLATELVADDPDFAKWWYWRAWCHKKIGETEEAINDYTQAINLDPTQIAYWLNRREIYMKLERFAEMLVDAEQASALDPNNYVNHMYQGTANFRLGKVPEAISNLSEAIALSPLDPHARAFRAAVYIANGDRSNAAEDFRVAVEQENPDPKYVCGRALLQAAEGDEEAYRDSCEYLVAEANMQGDEVALSSVAITCALRPQAIADYAVALQAGEDAMRLQMQSKKPQLRSSLTALGAIEFRAGRVDAARMHFDQAISSDPEPYPLGAMYYFFSMLHYQQGDVSAAKSSLATANQLASQTLEDHSDPAHWKRKLTYELLRKEAEALIGQQDDSTGDKTNRNVDNPAPSAVVK